MANSKIIGVRYFSVGNREVPVLLTRNESGSVSGQCLLQNNERPIIDGKTVGEVMAKIASALEGLLFAREARRS